MAGVRPGQGDVVGAQNVESGQTKKKGKGGRSGIGPSKSESGQVIGPNRPDPWAARLHRVRATLDRARRFEAWMLAQADRTPADLARREKVSRARVSQIQRLLKLAPEIEDDIERPGRMGRALGEIELRDLAGRPRAEQVSRYRALLGQDPEDLARGQGSVGSPSSRRDAHGSSTSPRELAERLSAASAVIDWRAPGDCEILPRAESKAQ